MRVVFVLLLAACGRVSFDPRHDAFTGDVPTGSATWGNVVEVVELNIGTINDDPTMTGDQLEIYFNSDRDGTPDIFVATRSDVAAAWGIPQKVIELSSMTVIENTPEVSADGLELYFARGTGNAEILVSTRATRADSWSTPVLVPELNSGVTDVAPYLTPDRLTILMSRATQANDYELFVTQRATTAASWAAPALVPELTSAAFDSDGYVTADQREIYWTSERAITSNDIWHAERAASGVPFANLAPVTELNTPMDDGDPWMSPDGRTLYFTRGTRQVEASIFMATR